ncbi:MAG: YihY/virulence factor BrkB family protein [Verrucomicrobiota bacterium]|nr:YihY/virulence factor BrkB family protein [Verrucomicrobiota bacterium]
MNLETITGNRAVRMLIDTFNSWMEDNALRLSAALAYYSIFSIAPLLVIAISIAGLALGPEAVNQGLAVQLKSYVGEQAAQAVQSMVQSASKPAQSKIAAVVGILTLLIGASAIFGQLKDALNTIWEVKQKSGAGVMGFVRERFLSFGMVLVIGFLLLVSLLLTAAFAGMTGYFENVLKLPAFIGGALGFVISFGMVTLLFAAIFKMLPDATVEWRNVWIGAAVTALLFEIGKFLLGWYLGRESTASTYGAAASVVLLLLWVYYASLILLFGAEFTQVYASATGSSIRPAPNAEPVTNEMRAQQGLSPGDAGPAKPEAERRREPSAQPVIVEVPVRSEPDRTVPPPIPTLLAATVVGFGVGLAARWRAERAQEPAEQIRRGLAGATRRGGNALSKLAARAAKQGRELVGRD